MSQLFKRREKGDKAVWAQAREERREERVLVIYKPEDLRVSV